MPIPIRRALVSVSDKSGITEFVRALVAQGIEILSTGGTAETLRQAGLPATDVSAVTGFPEIMDGRVKTLHPLIHGGILGITGNASHEQAMQTHGIAPIGLLVVNLYPFEETVEKTPVWSEVIEQIDVGGPAMIRGAAKNHADVTVIVDPGDYAAVLKEIVSNQNRTSPETRLRLAAKAFARTASYDAAISQWMSAAAGVDIADGHFATGGAILQHLRYGENPHQQALLVAAPGPRFGVTAARQLQGKELSYNNINDLDAALECLGEFESAAGPACVIVKHANPCGVALGGTVLEAYQRALACDPVSAFGGIIALNQPLDAAAAAEIGRLFTEVVVAPSVDDAALDVLAARKNLRVLVLDGRPASGDGLHVKSVGGGLLVQTRDSRQPYETSGLKIVSRRQPTGQELSDMTFAFRVAKHVKSNAIVYARNGATVAIGAGQMSRVDSARIAVMKAAGVAAPRESPVAGSVVASDAYFPFSDGLLEAARAGATAVIQPGGSIRDDEVIKAADDAGLAMVFTGIRHFRH